MDEIKGDDNFAFIIAILEGFEYIVSNLMCRIFVDNYLSTRLLGYVLVCNTSLETFPHSIVSVEEVLLFSKCNWFFTRRWRELWELLGRFLGVRGLGEDGLLAVVGDVLWWVLGLLACWWLTERANRHRKAMFPLGTLKLTEMVT